MRSMTWKQIAQFLNCPEPNQQEIVRGFCVDTRLLKPGEVFVALVGARVDGHAYLEEAQKKGAVAAIVAASYHGPNYGLHLFYVEDPLDALQELARAVLAKGRSQVVAVTGSVGKTTTKEFIKSLLSSRYAVAASPGNSNSQVGVPLAILNHTTGNEEIVILEMGMTEPGQLARLVQIAPPDVAVLTTAALVHACNFASLEAIALTKAEVFSHPKTKLGVLHHDLSNLAALVDVGSCPKMSFSTTSSDADYSLNRILDNTVNVKGGKETFRLGLLEVPGAHNVHNALAAIIVARYFGLSWEEIKIGLAMLRLPEKRLQIVQREGVIFLNDSYNASEVSTKAALETLPEPTGEGCKVAVFGSMMELGQFSHDCHKRVGEFALERVEKVMCLGEECRPIYDVWKKAGKSVELFLDRAALVAHLRAVLRPSDVVLLKGSRSKELWKVLEEL